MTRPVPAWFSVRTKPKHEHIAAEGLRRNPGFEGFLPQLQFEKATRSSCCQVTEPMFPGHLFVHCVIEDRITDAPYTNDVKPVVPFGDKIPTVPDSVIQDLQKHFEAGSAVEAGRHGLALVRRVRVRLASFLVALSNLQTLLTAPIYA